MAIFNSYVKLPQVMKNGHIFGNKIPVPSNSPTDLRANRRITSGEQLVAQSGHRRKENPRHVLFFGEDWKFFLGRYAKKVFPCEILSSFPLSLLLLGLDSIIFALFAVFLLGFFRCPITSSSFQCPSFSCFKSPHVFHHVFPYFPYVFP